MGGVCVVGGEGGRERERERGGECVWEKVVTFKVHVDVYTCVYGRYVSPGNDLQMIFHITCN